MTNQTQFAIKYREATELLLEALANPTSEGFSHAGALALVAQRSAYHPAIDAVGNGSVEWKLAQTLFDSITEVRRRLL